MADRSSKPPAITSLCLTFQLAQLTAETAGLPLSPVLPEAVARGRAFLCWLRAEDRSLVLGDSDDGAVLGTYASFAAKDTPQPVGTRTFSATGLGVFRGPEGERLVTFDFGPLGMAPGYGHGHADALAVTATSNHKPLFVDSGTGSYLGCPRIRSALRGTAAHNTVTVDEQDQATQRGAFLWSAPFRSRLLYSKHDASGALWLAGHTGYAALGVAHWRAVWVGADGVLFVGDWLRGSGTHVASLRWHCAFEPEPDGSALRLGRQQVRVFEQLDGAHLHRCRCSLRVVNALPPMEPGLRGRCWSARADGSNPYILPPLFSRTFCPMRASGRWRCWHRWKRNWKCWKGAHGHDLRTLLGAGRPCRQLHHGQRPGARGRSP